MAAARSTKPTTTRCPTCRRVAIKEGTPLSKVYPFCSERCQLLDLGRWLDEQYRVPGEPADPEEVAANAPPSTKDDEQ